MGYTRSARLDAARREIESLELRLANHNAERDAIVDAAQALYDELRSEMQRVGKIGESLGGM